MLSEHAWDWRLKSGWLWHFAVARAQTTLSNPCCLGLLAPSQSGGILSRPSRGRSLTLLHEASPSWRLPPHPTLEVEWERTSQLRRAPLPLAGRAPRLGLRSRVALRNPLRPIVSQLHRYLWSLPPDSGLLQHETGTGPRM